MHRSSGILLHPTSLPGPHPVGDLGPMAYRWIDWLAESGATWWQVLPINPPGFASSPYQCYSAFAGNPLLISPDLLLADGLIDRIPETPTHAGAVDFEAAIHWKAPVLEEASARLRRGDRFAEFLTDAGEWLDDHALFTALKRAFGGSSFLDWPTDIRGRSPSALGAARRRHADEIERQMALQFIFFDQWARLREYAAGRGIRLIGDIPIFVATDSADMWTRPGLFDLDATGRPRVVAGVPPDDFSATGQLWGNPLYGWNAHAADGYAWWISRLRWLLSLVDVVRIDHFRGFADYWEIPADAETAETGHWVPGPGKPFFDAVDTALGGLPFIAEDLGEMHDVVPALRDAVGLPGMKIGQTSFAHVPDPPSSWPENTVGYTGTHDNDTAVGWWRAAGRRQRRRARRLAGIGRAHPARDLMSAVWAADSVLAMSPVQDVVELGSGARMNTPATVGPHNWSWRLDALPDHDAAAWLRSLNERTGRVGAAPEYAWSAPDNTLSS